MFGWRKVHSLPSDLPLPPSANPKSTIPRDGFFVGGVYSKSFHLGYAGDRYTHNSKRASSNHPI